MVLKIKVALVTKPWVYLPIQVHHLVKAFLSVAIVSVLGNGQNTLFWTDNWVHVQNLARLVPHIYGVVSKRAKMISVFDVATNMRWVSDIRGVLTVNVFVEYLGVWDLVSHLVLQLEVEDTKIWRFSASAKYYAKSA
jgi:hypothetical protein